MRDYLNSELANLFPAVNWAEVGGDEDLFESGYLDSFDAVVLIEFFSELATFSTNFALEDLSSIATIDSIIQELKKSASH